MNDLVPAWSEPFLDDAGPGDAPALRLSRPIGRRWAYGDRSGRGVRVAILDSGIDSAHPAVRRVDRAVAMELDTSLESGVRVTEGLHDDLYGHGTACAGIVRSLAPEVELVSVRVLGANLKGSAHVVAHALAWCLDQGVHLVNLSLSTSNEDYFETFHDLVDRATFARMLIVSAMNNERRTTIPSEFAGVFSVACGPGADRERFWCSPDAPAEWAAAGIDVEVPWSGGGTVAATGNSFAAPVITGHLARLLGAHPGLTPWQARTVLAMLAENRPVS